MCTILLLKLLFWVSFFIISYAYAGYGLVLYALVRLKGQKTVQPAKYPDFSARKVAFIVCAFNEENYINVKISNSITTFFPKKNTLFVFVTDGSDDSTPDIVRHFEAPADTTVMLLHDPVRKGKIAAFQRAIRVLSVQIPDWQEYIVVTTDANTMLNPEAITNLVRHFDDPKIGAVAGEKRISMKEKDAANAAGEGFYWKYESLLKKWDGQLWSVVGAAGELFAFRVAAYEEVPTNTIVEDFYLTMRIAQKGYRVAYEPDAYAVETASASVEEELKRKIRIAAGGLQAIWRLRPLLNVFKYGLLSFQYISHRVLRWTLAPALLPVLLFANIALAIQGFGWYQVILILQVIFYLFALLGYVLERHQLKVKAFFIPYYFCMMNYAVYAGALRLWRGRQSVLWERAQRAVD